MKKEIIKILEKNEVVQQILQNQNHVGNLFYMEEALVLASAFQKDNKTRIIVKKNRYEAQQLYDRLSLLVPNVLLFVMEESLRVQAIAASPEDNEQLLYALTKIVKEKQERLVICNEAAYLRYLPNVEFFKENCFTLHVNDELDMATFKHTLNRIGYTKLNYVDRPCTFASRGGIVDVFTLEYEHPIRIEFFDTEIESIRFFDENTQRTIQSLDSIDIGPATDLLFTENEIEQIKEKVNSKLEKEKKILFEEEKELLVDHIEKDMMLLENYDTSPKLYHYFSYIHSSKLTDYLPNVINILSSKEELENYERKINEDNIIFIQELVQDRKSLSQYIMFHTLDSVEKENTMVYFHEFLDYENPIVSNIFPLEPASKPLEEQLETINEKCSYLALSKEDREKVENCGCKKKFVYIEPDFYEGFIVDDIYVYTCKELFFHRKIRNVYQKSFKQGKILENVLELEKNDYIVHEQYGIGQYLGIVTREQKGKMQDYLHIAYKGNDELFVPLSQFQLVRKFVSHEGASVHLSKLGTSQWKKTKEKVNAKIEEIANRLVDLYAARNENIGFAFSKDDALQREFDESFEYEDTPDQYVATQQIKAEMEKPKPMDHLLCGDVGFGKTEVAMRCAFKAIENGKQVIFLCPTTILSMQHYQTVSKRFENVGANIALVNRFVSTKDITQIKKKLENGSIDIVIGTHKILNKSFKYKDLGLLIIDEEQRFGVEHKEKIKEMKNSIDVLSLSATPIPRTMQMSLIGVRTISQLNTPPAKRHPVQTYVIEKRDNAIKEIIQRELSRSGQVFYLHNRVSTIYAVAKKLQKMFPNIKVGVAHGKMNREDIEQIMYDFSQNEYDILVCTTIIETGLDIANANTIIIEEADRFGLSQLYQIRGRVGRRERIAYCYLMIQPEKQLTEEATKRLKSIKEFTQLGSGYKIAMRDLTIRGAGDLLGPQQAGFIDQIGLDLYLELLAQAIARKQGKEIKKEVPEKRAQIQLNGYIPKQFTDNDGDKLSLYQEIKKVKSLDELSAYETKVNDIFGHVPVQVENIFEQKKLDIFVNTNGVESLVELDKNYVIKMNENWTKNCDGVKLFEKINKVSSKIDLRLKNKMIEISIPKKNKNNLMKVMKILESL